MKMKAIYGALITAILSINVCNAEKRALSHEDLDGWKGVENHEISRKGEWCCYSVNPQAGDGVLTFRNIKTGKTIDIPRGYKPAFLADGNWAVVMIKPEYEKTRKAKIAKKKDHQMPQDSIAILNLKTSEVKRIGDVTEYKIAKEGGEWVAWKSCDTAYIKPKKLADNKICRPLVVHNLPTGVRKVVKNVDNWTFSKDGKKLALTISKEKGDTLSTNSVGVIFFPDTSYVVVDRDKPFYGVPVFDSEGNQLAFTCSTDTLESGTKKADVYVSDLRHPMKSGRKLSLAFKDGEGKDLLPNQYTKLTFSHNGKRLIAGVAPVIAPDDTTIYDFEQGKLDIWRWDAPLIPPREKSLLKEIKHLSLPVAVTLSNDKAVLLSDNPYEDIKEGNRWDSDWALVIDPTENYIDEQWDYFAPTKMWMVSLTTGERREIPGKFMREEGVRISPEGKYVAWFADRKWNVYDVTTGNVAEVGKDVPTELWNTDDEHPSPSMAWGSAGWTAGDRRFLVYDRHDIWSLDPKGVDASINLTRGEGKNKDLQIRYVNTDPESRFISEGDLMLFSLFDYKDKYNGLGWMKYGRDSQPHLSVLDGHSYQRVRKAKDAPVFTWQRGNFSEIPEIFLSKSTDFVKAECLTNVNDQLKDFKWGTARLVRWHTYDGKPAEGVLYVPDDLDTAKQYPMLCVFYETGSEDLYRHYRMEPSWSWVNYPFYVSRGYVIFVPDIHYTSGRPGEDAYNYVCSGAEEMCRQNPWIDKERIGIDGQSWGGYQTAYLITRTNMFACAGSGAPVANMTSAYGGIRWGTGSSRQAQYEQGQSRIGGNLWDKKEAYIANSPVFFANKVETPLLIMHNDQDEAVPWYQGIEYFMALRRLHKPVWMLQYNGESHNIKARKNRKDITRRLQQFFDHYLKGEPMPRWMKEGVPMIRKGQEFGW